MRAKLVAYLCACVAFSLSVHAQDQNDDADITSANIVAAPNVESRELSPTGTPVIAGQTVDLSGGMDDGRMPSGQSGETPRIDLKNIKPMTPDAAIKSGKLSSGLKYYFIANKNVKGIADFTLLTPDTLLQRRDVALFNSDLDCDRTLIDMFDIYKDISKTCVLIVAGDIDVDKMIHKVSLLSLLETSKQNYSFHHNDDFFFSSAVSSVLASKTLTFCFESPRLHLDLLNTALPLAMARMDMQVGILCTKSLEQALSAKGIGYEEVRFEQIREDQHFGHNKYKLVVSFPDDGYAFDNQAQVESLVMDILWNIKTGNFSNDVFAGLVRETKYSLIESLSSLPVTNQEYVSRCLKAEIFNTSLASRETVMSINSKPRPDSKSLEIFSRYCKRLFNGLEQPRDTLSLLKINYKDTVLSSISSSRKKMKVSRTFLDTSTGGTTWVFANGLRVCYRKMDTNGLFYYGVYSTLPELNIEETNLLGALGFSHRHFPDDKLQLFIKLLAYYSGGAFERDGIVFLVGNLNEEYVRDKFATYAHNFYMVHNPAALLDYFDAQATLANALASIALVRNPGARQINEEEMNVVKTILTEKIASMEQSPLFWLECARIRYCCGRKINTGYQHTISNITLESVNAVLGSLSTSDTVETSPWIISR